MWELDLNEGWMLKNQCFWILVLEKTLKSSLDSKQIKPVNPKENLPWIFIGRTDAEAEAPILWPANAKSQLIRKDPDTRKDWRQEEKEMTEDEMAGWHHRLDSHEFEQAQGSLAFCSPWGHKEPDTSEQLNWTELKLLSGFSIRGELRWMWLIQNWISPSQPSRKGRQTARNETKKEENWFRKIKISGKNRYSEEN